MGPFPIADVPSGLVPTDEDRVALAEVAIERAYDPGERLASFLRPSEELIRVEEGLVALRGYDEDDGQWTLAFLGPGDWVDGRTLTRPGPRVFEVVAMTAGRGLAVDWTALEKIARARPAVVVAVARSLADLAALLAETTLESRGIDVRHRLERLLLEFVPPERADGEGPVELAYPFTHQELARAVGASRPHTSFVLGELEALGAVVRRGQRPVMVRPHRLRELLEAADRPGD